MYQIIAYFKYLLRSTNQHGVHSPFVYRLVTRCFYDKKNYSSYVQLNSFREALLKNSSSIEVKDIGAGSRVFNSSERRVKDIARTAGISKKRARLLNRLVRHLKIRSALELGTSLGMSSIAMAAGNDIVVTTIEGCPNTAKFAREQFDKSKFGDINLQIGDFRDYLSKLPQKENKYDLIYFDGNHKKQATLEYFKSLIPFTQNDSVFIFDDIHWSREMTEAWEEIKAHPSVKVTIDTFFWGLVFFRKEQEKEHFVIRL